MSSRPRSLVRTSRRKRSSRRRLKPSLCDGRKSSGNFGNGGGVEVGISEKLEALKNLIPAKNGEMKAERLFEETADYIVLLKAQVEMLQRMIDFYGSDEKKKVV